MSATVHPGTARDRRLRGWVRTDAVRIGPRAALAITLVSLAGLAMFLWPLWIPASPSVVQYTTDAPFLFLAVLPCLILVVLAEMSEGGMDSKALAMLGVLSAVNAALRPLGSGVGGLELLFFVLILAGRVFGPGFGFVLGCTSMFASGLLTAGVGPWLPFQMLVLAWVGAALGLIGRATRRMPPTAELAVVAVAAWASAFLYGVLINLWSWPLTPGEGELQWHPGLGAGETLRRYWSFYVATSSAWDAAGAFANAVAVIVLGRPVLATLRRFAARLDPVVELDADDLDLALDPAPTSTPA